MTAKNLLWAILLPSLFSVTATLAQQNWEPKAIQISTRWTKKVDPLSPLSEYPRPQMQRQTWQSLNGLWEYAIVRKNDDKPDNFDGKILVPFPVESSLSGVKKDLMPNQELWYKRTILKPVFKTGEKILLHFGAVDWQATVYLNGRKLGMHQGGYTGFSFDITKALKAGKNELVVKVFDPSDKGNNPHGKQTLTPQGILYTPSSGIWQTVWIETVPSEYISGLKIVPDIDKSVVRITVKSNSSSSVNLQFEGKNITGITNREITVPVENVHLWSPNDPYLYGFEVKLRDDVVESYFGMRKVEIRKDEKGIERIFLNNKYTYNLGTLDQGFWPDGLYTAPTDEALAFDIKAAKVMGFNTIRKHIKAEPARWYYHADKLGMLVWQDLINPGSDTKEGRAEFEKENRELISQLCNYPSITTWVVFNEGWGTYDQGRITKEVKALDSTRIVNGHTGENYHHGRVNVPEPEQWLNSDVTDIHTYPTPKMPPYKSGKARVLGEFGGIGVSVENHKWNDLVAGWGYDGTVKPAVMKQQYSMMTDSLIKLEKMGLSGSIYTQPFDVESEQNGLITYDRMIAKIPLEELKAINNRLWPATNNISEATTGLVVQVADTVIVKYQERLMAYANGNRDPQFLRNLALMGIALKNQDNSEKFVNEYIKLIKGSMKVSDLNFISRFSTDPSSAGYDFLKTNLDTILKVGGMAADQGIQDVYFNERMLPVLKVGKEGEITSVLSAFPIVGEQNLMFKVLSYFSDSKEPGAFKQFAKAVERYVAKYPVKASDYNQWAWNTFTKSESKQDLITASKWSAISIKLDPIPNHMDTYANLLYKIGNIKEALKWENKAIEKDGLTGGFQQEEFKKTLEKMKKQLPTW